MNLSGNGFVFPPTDPAAVVKVRIFTPTQEIPFAGHPVIGTFSSGLARLTLRERSRGYCRNVISACFPSISIRMRG